MKTRNVESGRIPRWRLAEDFATRHGHLQQCDGLTRYTSAAALLLRARNCWRLVKMPGEELQGTGRGRGIFSINCTRDSLSRREGWCKRVNV